MGKASISIAVTGSYNGAALGKAESALDRLAVKVAGAEKNLNTASGQMVKHGSQWAEAGGEIYNTGAKIEGAGKKMLGVSAAIVGTGVATGKAAITIDTALTGVRKTVDGTEEQYQALKESAIAFSETNAVSADQILDIQALGAQLGFSIDELDEFSKVVSGLDIATDMDAETAATQMAQFANITKMSHGEVSNFGSAIVNLGNNMATTESSISNMAMRTAAAGTQIGMSQSQILGWSAAMSSMGIEAEAGGTAFSTFVSTIDTAVATGSDDVQKYAKIAGMSASDFSTAWKNSASDTTIALLKGMEASGNMNIALQEMGITGIRESDVLKRLAGNTDLVTQALQVSNQGWQENTALTNEVENRNSSLAAKLEILQNKVTAIAEDIGTPLVTALTDAIDAAEPMIKSVENATTAFSNMDTGSQRVVIGLAAATAAAGPFLIGTGKIVKGVGNVVTAFGKVQQTVGVYADAMSTTDVASLKAYESNKKLAKALEANPLSKAAGGVDKYVAAVQKANADTSALSAAERELASEQKKGSKANQDLIANLQDEIAKKKVAKETSTGLVEGYQAEAAASEVSTAATKAHAIGLAAFTSAMNIAKVAMATFAPMLIVAGISALATAISDAKEHAETLTAATDGLTAASAGATNQVQQESSIFDIFTGAANQAKDKVDEVLSSQAQLADTIRDTNTSAASQTAQLQDAYSTIQQYANQTDLSTDAQGKLRSAVETVNSMCGTQISVTDAANGKLADENGALEDVTGALGDYVQKKLEQIRVDAQQQNLSDLYKQQASDIEALAGAQKDYNSKLVDHDTYVQQYRDNLKGYAAVTDEMADAAYNAYVAELQQSTGVTEAQAALDACNTSIGNVTASLGASAAVADGASASVANLAASNATVSSAIQGVGGDLTAFTRSLSDAGVSVETFRSLNDEQLIQLVTSWDGTSQSIVSTLQAMGVDMGDAGLSAATALANGMESGSVSVDTATSILQAAAKGDWSSVASQMQSAGFTIPQGVADGISSGSYTATAQTDAMLSAIALKLTGGDVKAAADLLGHDIDQGLADGIANGTLSEDQAQMLGQDVIDKAKDSLQSHSPSQAFYQIGSDVDAGLSQGISGNSSDPLSAVAALGQGLIDAISGLPGLFLGNGTSSSTGMANGLRSGSGNVSAQAIGLANNAQNGVSGTPGALGSTGTSAGARFAAGIGSGRGSTSSNAAGLAGAAGGGVSGAPGTLGRYGSSAGSSFASGIGSGRGSTSSNAASLARAAQGVRNYGNPYSWGNDLGRNFASGISAARGWVSSAASAIANAAKSILHFSVPDEGPWSGAERGGVRSGMHLAQNFAEGMRLGGAEVQDAARSLAEDAQIGQEGPRGAQANGGQQPAGQTVVNNYYYTMGDVAIDASTIKEFMTMEEFFRFMRRAKAGA